MATVAGIKNTRETREVHWTNPWVQSCSCLASLERSDSVGTLARCLSKNPRPWTFAMCRLTSCAALSALGYDTFEVSGELFA